jgi:cell division septation protein DedD
METQSATPTTSALVSVQVGAFKIKENADRLSDRLKNKAYEAEVVRREDSEHQIWYLVRVGRYTDRALARSVAEKLAAEVGLNLKPLICAR